MHSTLERDSSVGKNSFGNYLPQCSLIWRQNQLLVSLEEPSQQPYISAFESEQQLVDCLKHSPVRMVCLDPILGEAALQHWADACKQANKLVFIRGGVQKQLKKPLLLGRQQKPWIDAIAAFCLLILLSPILSATAIFMYFFSASSIFSRKWHIGSRGKFFQLLQFDTTAVDDGYSNTLLLRWICNSKLDSLPQLLNVLRGEMSLIDSPALTLAEAVRLSSVQKVNNS